MLESWEKVIDPNFINSELIGTAGAEKIVTITDIDYAECYDEQTKKKIQKQTVFFAECKPLVLNKTNAKTLKRLFSSNDDNPANAKGKKVRLVVESIKAFGKQTDAIRIKEYSEEKCEGCGNAIYPAAGKGIAELIEISKRNCGGKQLCVKCMNKYKEGNKNNE
ncbi:MAG: hypothetical protein MJ197_10115 [Bacteroidales bacterium]|nr:hypothetical protein [Bacteroidales bacterium]